MNRLIINLFFCTLSGSSFSQDGLSWQIWHNNTVLFHATAENVDSNRITVLPGIFTSKGVFGITFSEQNVTEKKAGWIRTIAIYDEIDNELYKKVSGYGNFITDKRMNKLLLKNKIVKIYTWALPKDPAEAARIRIRRVHLCTIVLR